MVARRPARTPLWSSALGTVCRTLRRRWVVLELFYKSPFYKRLLGQFSHIVVLAMRITLASLLLDESGLRCRGRLTIPSRSPGFAVRGRIRDRSWVRTPCQRMLTEMVSRFHSGAVHAYRTLRSRKHATTQPGAHHRGLAFPTQQQDRGRGIDGEKGWDRLVDVADLIVSQAFFRIHSEAGPGQGVKLPEGQVEARLRHDPASSRGVVAQTRLRLHDGPRCQCVTNRRSNDRVCDDTFGSPRTSADRSSVANFQTETAPRLFRRFRIGVRPTMRQRTPSWRHANSGDGPSSANLATTLTKIRLVASWPLVPGDVPENVSDGDRLGRVKEETHGEIANQEHAGNGQRAWCRGFVVDFHDKDSR